MSTTDSEAAVANGTTQRTAQRYVLRNLKIEHLWEPTPFPLERMGD